MSPSSSPYGHAVSSCTVLGRGIMIYHLVEGESLLKITVIIEIQAYVYGKVEVSHAIA